MHSRLRLSVALGDYDLTRPVIDGDVRPAGIDVVPLVYPSPQRHWRMLRHREFDVCELSLGSYVALLSRGDDSLVGLPVFPHRRFRHSYAFVTGKRPLNSPGELAGGRVGVRSRQTTVGIYLRGILAEHHGLPVDSVQWIAQDTEDVEDVAIDLPAAVRLERVPAGRTVTAMCAAGELDGLLYPEIPEQVRAGTGEIRRLFDDPQAAEEAYFRRTGVFPIMHLLVVRRDVVARHRVGGRQPRRGVRRGQAGGVAAVAGSADRQPCLAALAGRAGAGGAGRDAWDYGLTDRNRHVLETFLGYAEAHGVSVRKLAAEDLFAPSVLAAPPGYV